MLRPSGERRSSVHKGQHTYDLWCWSCNSDRDTLFDKYRIDEGWCSNCHLVIRLDDEERHAALEPQRLDDRMAQVQAERIQPKATEAERALDHFLSGAPMRDFEG